MSSYESIKLELDGSSGNIGLEKEIAQVFLQAFEVFKKKQASYGSGNISAFGAKGVVVRMNDKLQRLIRLVWHGYENPLEDEATSDTLLDMVNYAAITLLCLLNKWPGLENSHDDSPR